MQTRLLQLLVAAAETVADAAVTVDVEAAIEIAVEAEIGIEADVAEIAVATVEAVAAETEIVALAQSELLAKPRPTKETTENRRSSMFPTLSQSEIVAAMTTTSTPASDLDASN